MADHSKPVLGSTYTNVLSELDGRFDDLSLWLDSATTTPTNLPAGAKRWNSSAYKWEKWSGTAWSDMAATYGISISGNAGTVTNGVYSNGSYSDPAWLTSLAGSKISGNIAGNAATATKLATARNINGVAFDGSAAVTVPTNTSLTFNNGGSGDASGTTFNGNTARTISYNTIGAPKTDGTGASGTWGISVTGSAAKLISSLISVLEISGSLHIQYNGVTVFKIDSTGNVTASGSIVAAGDVTAYGSV